MSKYWKTIAFHFQTRWRVQKWDVLFWRQIYFHFKFLALRTVGKFGTYTKEKDFVWHIMKTKIKGNMLSFKTALDARRYEGLPEVSTISHEIVEKKRNDWLLPHHSTKIYVCVEMGLDKGTRKITKMWLLKTNQKKHHPEQNWREDRRSRSVQNAGFMAIKHPNFFPANVHFQRRNCSM